MSEDKGSPGWNGSGAHGYQIDWSEATRKGNESVAKRQQAHQDAIAARKAERQAKRKDTHKGLIGPIDPLAGRRGRFKGD